MSANVVKLLLVIRIVEREENRQVIGVENCGRERVVDEMRNRPGEEVGEVGGDEGNVGRGWLRVGWEASWEGGVEDGEIGVEKGIGESVAARIR